MPPSALTPAIRDEIARLGRADIMVGIPSFKNAATIGYVVRAAQAGLVQYFPDLRPVLVNCDAGSPDGTQRVVVETEPPDYVEPILLVRPTNRLDRVSLTYPEIDGVGGKGAALRTIFEIAAALEVQALVVVDSDLRSIVPGVDRAARRPDPQGRLRLRRPALRPLQVRRHDHQHRHLPADAGAVRAPDPAADRRRLRRLGRPRPALPRAGRLDRGRQQVRHRHLDDDQGAHRRLRGLPDPARREGPRPQGPGRGPRPDVPPGRRHDPAARGGARRPWLGDPRLARRPGLRLRADHRPAAARGERDPPAVASSTAARSRSPTRGAGRSRRRTSRRCSSWPRRPARPPTARRGRSGWAARVARPPPTTVEMAEALGGFHFPDDLWARCIYDLVHRDPDAARSRPASSSRRCAALLRPGRQLRHREPQRDDRPRPRSASSARRASSSCSSRTSWSAGGR